MAKNSNKKKTTTENEKELFGDSSSTISQVESEIETRLREEAREIGRENRKKTHVSVLLSHEDFEYVRDLCFRKRKSKNEFFKAALEAYKRGEWEI